MNWINAKFPVMKASLYTAVISFVVMPIVIYLKSDSLSEAIMIASWVLAGLVMILIPVFIFLYMKYNMQIREDGGAAMMRNVEVPAHAINKAELWVETNQVTIVFCTIDGLSNRISLRNNIASLKADGLEALIYLIQHSSIPEQEYGEPSKKQMGNRIVLPAGKILLIEGLQGRLDSIREIG